MIPLKNDALRVWLALSIIFLTVSTMYGQKGVRVDQYIKVTPKNVNQFEVFNKSGTQLGIIFSNKPSKTIYLNPARSKTFSYKKYPITSRIALHYKKKTWDNTSAVLEREFYKIVTWSGVANFFSKGDDILHNARKYRNKRKGISTQEQERQDRRHQKSKELQKDIFQDAAAKVTERLIYYGHLYHASNGYDGRYFIPVKLSTAVSSY
ncbi:hypothetical protein [Aquimarina algiphila]|uniref:Uncharacterized protein n=1 Tax=Aquimarina algiphila TaxID=2047982 RepID=A0A554VIE2_9FLAO|nr:hypothetical protein [Aquimarina algiphila]TSE07419.1 hypothetical protein FOF46_16005 [Aquimarina algiphila]